MYICIYIYMCIYIHIYIFIYIYVYIYMYSSLLFTHRLDATDLLARSHTPFSSHTTPIKRRCAVARSVFV